MPTPEERLATLESLTASNSRRIDDVYASINGGVGFEWEQSVRGRLHAMANILTALTMRDARKNEERRSAIRTWQWSVIAFCAVATVVSPYVLFFASR